MITDACLKTRGGLRPRQFWEKFASHFPAGHFDNKYSYGLKMLAKIADKHLLSCKQYRYDLRGVPLEFLAMQRSSD
jgi:hypothetical protein